MQNTQGIELEYSEITFKRDNHKNRFSMGIGSFGEVYVASFRGQEVAIKELKREAIKNGVNEFLNESIILRRMKHPNIINLYGICTDRAINCKNLSERENFYCLVMEYGSKGSLHNLIHESNEIFDEKKNYFYFITNWTWIILFTLKFSSYYSWRFKTHQYYF